MADQKLSELGAASALSAANTLYVVQSSTDKAATVQQVLDASVGALEGFRSGMTITYDDATHVTVNAGAIEIGGVVYTLASATQVEVTGAGGFIMIDVPDSGTILGAADIDFTGSAIDLPSFDADKGGYYYAADATERCIGGALMNAGAISAMAHITAENEWVYFYPAQGSADLEYSGNDMFMYSTIAGGWVDLPPSEVRKNLDLEIGTDVLAQQTIGIGNDNLVEMDDADAAENDYCKLTTNGIVGRSYSEVLSDLSGQASADFSMNSHKITSVTDPTADQDAATKKYVDDNAGGDMGSLEAYRSGLVLSIKDDDEVYVSAGAIEINGTQYFAEGQLTGSNSVGSYSADRCTGGTPSTYKEHGTYGVANAFDDDTGTCAWSEAFFSSYDWWQYQFASAQQIRKLRILPCTGQLSDVPKDFTLLASNTGNFSGEEVTLLTETGKTGYQADTWEEWTFDNENSYTYYRIYVTDVVGDGNYRVVLAEVEMLEYVYDLTASSTYHVYVDIPDSGTTLANGDIEFSTTAPSFTDAKGAKYRSDDATQRYLGSFVTDGDGDISHIVGKTKYIPASEFEITTGNSGEINSTGTHGHSMTDGELSTMSYRPLEELGIDVTEDTNIQVIWCSIDGTATNGVTWLVTYDADNPESGVLTAPATALDTAIVEDNENDTPYTIQKTEAGVIDADTLTDGDMIAIRVEADTVDSGNDPGCWFMGILISQ